MKVLQTELLGRQLQTATGAPFKVVRVSDPIDAAYRAKYRRYAASIVQSVLIPAARSATIKLEPRPVSV